MERKTALVHPGSVCTEFQVPDCRCSLCAVPGRAPVPAQSMTQLWLWAGLSPGTRPPPAPPHHKQQVYSSHSRYSSAASSQHQLSHHQPPQLLSCWDQLGLLQMCPSSWCRELELVLHGCGQYRHGAVCSTFPGWLTVTLLGD